MNFAVAWPTFNIGAFISVSDGTVEIPHAGAVEWRCWRSHNHVGKLVEKIDQTPRRMIIELSPMNGAVTQYELVEGMGHDFTASNASTSINNASVSSQKMRATFR